MLIEGSRDNTPWNDVQRGRGDGRVKMQPARPIHRRRPSVEDKFANINAKVRHDPEARQDDPSHCVLG